MVRTRYFRKDPGPRRAAGPRLRRLRGAVRRVALPGSTGGWSAVGGGRYRDPPCCVALTGGIGSGKSTVAAGLARRGAAVVDADAVGREILEPDGAAYQTVVDHFGPGVVRPDGRSTGPLWPASCSAMPINSASSISSPTP